MVRKAAPRRTPAIAHRDLEREQAAHRQTLAENERLRSLLEVRGPIREFARAYADLVIAAHPLQGRQLDAHRGGGVFDRPLPHERTARLRGQQERAERLMRHATTAMQEALGDKLDVTLTLSGICGGCGQRLDADRRGRRTAVEAAGEFLQAALADGPVESAQLIESAKRSGISERTLRRAKDRGSIASYLRDNTWFWDVEVRT